jgi:hypothetical protein
MTGKYILLQTLITIFFYLKVENFSPGDATLLKISLNALAKLICLLSSEAWGSKYASPCFTGFASGRVVLLPDGSI